MQCLGLRMLGRRGGARKGLGLDDRIAFRSCSRSHCFCSKAELVFKVPAGTYLYREMARVQVLEAGTLEIDAADLPPGVMRFDEAFGREREVWEFDAIAMLPLTAPSQVGSYTVLLDVGYQGCRGGLCFMPVQSELELILNVTESQ